jgi:hypothetical protein
MAVIMIKKIGTIEAILAINPDAQVGVHGEDYDTIEWGDTSVISKADIDAKIVELEAEWTAQEYARNRKAEYPDMGTQLNKIYDDGIDAWKTDMVDPIKAKYPKP